MGRFETEVLTDPEHVDALTELSGKWIDRVRERKPIRELILDLDRSLSETYGSQEGTAYNGHFNCTCYHPLFLRVGFIVTNPSRSDERVVKFYNGRGTAEQWIKEGKNAVKWTPLSCHDFVDNHVRLQLFSLAYNLGNFLRRLALPPSVKHWSMTTLREKLIKIGAKVVTHARYVTFQMAEAAISRQLFKTILRRISRLGPVSPVPI